MPLGSFIRVRTYGREGQESVTFFEVKKAQGEATAKQRVPIGFYQDSQMLPMAFLQSLGGALAPELIEELSTCMRNDSNSALYPFIKTSSDRLYFASNDVRATIDTHSQYTGYFGMGRTQAHLMGEDEEARLEVKADNPAATEQVRQTLQSFGVGLTAIRESRKEQLQRLYLTTKLKLKEQEGIMDEAPGYEIEEKLLVDATEDNPLHMVDQIAEDTALGNVPHFSYPQGMAVRDVNSHVILFGRDKGQQLEEALVVVTDEPANLYALKRKLPVSSASEHRALIRPEEKKILVGIFDDQTRRELLEHIEQAIGDRLIEVGAFDKSKRFTTVVHESGRMYDISVDQSRSGQETLTQWEIEYKGRKMAEGTHDANALQGISDEIAEMSSYIQKRFPGKVEPTTLTKFEWFMETGQQR